MRYNVDGHKGEEEKTMNSLWQTKHERNCPSEFGFYFIQENWGVTYEEPIPYHHCLALKHDEMKGHSSSVLTLDLGNRQTT
jgi:hypothetical protein